MLVSKRSHAMALLAAACLAACTAYESMDGANRSYPDPYGYSPDFYPGTEKYGELALNPFVETARDSLSTFAADVDAGSYTLARRKIDEGGLPDAASVRVEEYVNYFDPAYPDPAAGPLAIHADGMPSPYRSGLRLLRVGLSTPAVKPGDRKRWNLTFLVDVSGSMTGRIALVKEALYLLADQLKEGDVVSLVTYAGSVRTVIAPTPVDRRDDIKAAIAGLSTGGSTAMGSGIRLAYEANLNGFIQGGENRVIVCSDGDANVGETSHEAILETIRGYARQGVTLSTLGFGQGNYNAVMMEQLADQGNGNYHYIDSGEEAKRLFSGPLPSLLQTLVFDVKIQVELRAAAVAAYRLIGYENRDLSDSSFQNPDTDAGEIGPGHKVTALYELRMAPGSENVADIGMVRVRYQVPGGAADVALERTLGAADFAASAGAGKPRLRFAAAVGEFADVLRDNPYVEGTSVEKIETELMETATTAVEEQELLGLLRKAKGRLRR